MYQVQKKNKSIKWQIKLYNSTINNKCQQYKRILKLPTTSNNYIKFILSTKHFNFKYQEVPTNYNHFVYVVWNIVHTTLHNYT